MLKETAFVFILFVRHNVQTAHAVIDFPGENEPYLITAEITRSAVWIICVVYAHKITEKLLQGSELMSCSHNLVFKHVRFDKYALGAHFERHRS